MPRKKKEEEIERVQDAGGDAAADAIDYAAMCRECLLEYFRKHHDGEGDYIANFARISKEPRNVFHNALQYCRASLGTFPGLKVPLRAGGRNPAFEYDQERARWLAEVFLDLCQRTDNSPSAMGFRYFSGIEVATLRRWKGTGTGAGAEIWAMIAESGKESTMGKLDDGKVPLSHIAKMNRETEDGLYAKNADSSAKTIDQIVAEMGIAVETRRIESKEGANDQGRVP